MRRNKSEEGNGSNNNGSGSLWGSVAAIGAVATVGAGALAYYLTRKNQSNQYEEAPVTRTPRSHESGSNTRNVSEFLSSLVRRMDSSSAGGSRRGVSRRSIPPNPTISNLDSLLHDVYLRFVALDETDFELHYKVFSAIFREVHNSMKQVDPYYNKYSSAVQFCGSHYDRLRIKKPDEFDMDIVIGLPLNIKSNIFNPGDSDIVLEPKSPGYVQLKMGTQFQRLHMRDGDEWETNKAAYEWKDCSNYLLRSKFTDWFKGVVDRALKNHETTTPSVAVFNVDGVAYTVRRGTESGPAMTLFIENKSRGFRMDVDLVPTLKFPEDRWPICRRYRPIPPGCNKGYWMVVPKPNKGAQNLIDANRSWRLALHEQERGLLYNTYNMRQAIRLLKQLRDAQDMHKIASYYIKTLFLLEAERMNDPEFWKRNSPAIIFVHMVKVFHCALVTGEIQYFWNRDNNLIGQVPRNILSEYARKVGKLVEVLDQPSKYKEVAKFLLAPTQFAEYNRDILHI